MSSDKGFGVLEWTGKLVPQGLLVKGSYTPELCTGHCGQRSALLLHL